MRGRADRDPLAIDPEDHVARFKSGRACRTIRLSFRDESTFGGFQTETVRDFLGHRLNLDANPTPCDHAFVFQRRDDGLRGIGGNGKTNADFEFFPQGIDFETHHLGHQAVAAAIFKPNLAWRRAPYERPVVSQFSNRGLCVKRPVSLSCVGHLPGHGSLRGRRIAPHDGQTGIGLPRFEARSACGRSDTRNGLAHVPAGRLARPMVGEVLKDLK